MSASGDLRHLTVLFDQLQDVVDPPVLLRCLNLAAEHYLTVDPARALELADALVAAAAWAGDARSGALGLLGRGDAMRRLGRLQEAVAALDEAGAAFRALPGGDEVGWARTRIGWVVAQHALGDWQSVPETVGAAMAVFTRHGEWLRAVKLASNVGVIHFERAEYGAALTRDDEALAYCRRLLPEDIDLQLLTARIRSNRALVLAELGDFDAALSELEAARELFAQHGQVDSALAQALNIAYVRRGIGAYGAALAQLDEVVPAARRSGHLGREASARHEQALIYLELGDCTNALHQADEAYQLYHVLEGESATASDLLILCAEIQSTLGDHDEAFDLLDVADSLHHVAGALGTNEAARLSAAIALARAELRLAGGDAAAAEADARLAATAFEALGRRNDLARARLVQARALLGLGQVTAAVAQAEALLAGASPGVVRPWLAPCHHLLATAARGAGDLADARQHLAAAIAALETLAGSLAPNLRSAIQANQHIYSDAVDLAIEAGEEGEAFDLLERSKSPALLARLIGTDLPNDGDRAATDPVLADRMRRYHYQVAQLQRLVAEPASPAGKARITRLRAAVRALEAELSELQAHGPRLGAGTENLFTSAADSLAALLPPDAVLVEYHLSPSRGAAFVLSRDHGLSCHPLALNRAQADDLVDAWRDRVAELQRVREHSGSKVAVAVKEAVLRYLSGHMYQRLVAEIAGELADCGQLIIVPYGPLHALPFAALHDGERYLFERHDLTVAPSGAVLRHSLARQTPASGQAVVLGNDWQGRLPGCHAEALAVADILGSPALVGDAATLTALRSASDAPCAVLHVAAHGEARLDNPLFSHLALADGHLTSLAAMDLSLAGALVTLSACETGRGLLTGGDEVVGLSGAFLSAGAAAVMQSLWRIDDRFAADLMADFYRHLQLGDTVATALRAAQRDCRAEAGASVVDWAPYQVVGNGLLRLAGVAAIAGQAGVGQDVAE
jgi:CHAT domain-containing protein/tetratricopeptide (TPR) repeat protein